MSPSTANTSDQSVRPPEGAPHGGPGEGGMSTPKGRRSLAISTLQVGAGLLLAGCAGHSNGQNSLTPRGPQAREIDTLFRIVASVAAVIGVAVLAATVVVALRYRRRRDEAANPRQVHGNTPLELAWTIAPAVILAVLAVPTVRTIFSLAEEPPRLERLDVVAVGKQWWWEFQYPRQPRFGIDRRIVTSTELHIPAGVPVNVRLESDNVIHSFWVPELNGKKDVMPGRRNRLTIEADRPGTYLGQCAEYCGLAHADMRFRVIAQRPEAFRAWVRDQRRGPAQPWRGEIEQLTAQKYQCTNCHVFDDSSRVALAPNLTHLASRTTFAGGTFALNRSDLVRWILDAPSLVPMQARDCRRPPPATCVGMPSYTRNTPRGQPVMTRRDAEVIADYLLAQR